MKLANPGMVIFCIVILKQYYLPTVHCILHENVKGYKQRSFPRESKVALSCTVRVEVSFTINARAVRLQGQRLSGNVPLPRCMFIYSMRKVFLEKAVLEPV